MRFAMQETFGRSCVTNSQRGGRHPQVYPPSLAPKQVSVTTKARAAVRALEDENRELAAQDEQRRAAEAIKSQQVTSFRCAAVVMGEAGASSAPLPGGLGRLRGKPGALAAATRAQKGPVRSTCIVHLAAHQLTRVGYQIP